MIEEKIWSIADVARRPGADIVRGEPSHIHLPRRRRAGRPDEQGTDEARAVYISHEERRWHSEPVSYGT